MGKSERGGKTWTPLHELCFKADTYSQKKLLMTAEMLVGIYGVNATTDFGNTPLHFACACDVSELALYLLSAGADVSCVNDDEESPLHYAVLHSNVQVVANTLASVEADVNAPDSTGCTALHWSVQQTGCPIEIIHLLLQAGADVMARDRNDDTPMHYAAREGAFDIYQHLKASCEQENSYNKQGFTPLHAACRADQADFVSIHSVTYPGSEMWLTRDTDKTCLLVAVRARAKDTVSRLLQMPTGGEMVSLDDAHGRTPFIVAMAIEEYDIARILKEAGAGKAPALPLSLIRRPSRQIQPDVMAAAVAAVEERQRREAEGQDGDDVETKPSTSRTASSSSTEMDSRTAREAKMKTPRRKASPRSPRFLHEGMKELSALAGVKKRRLSNRDSDL